LSTAVSVPTKKQASQPEPLADALDRLYGAPLEQFVALRRELGAALRVAGELPASRLVATATKPTRTAWALNQVARRQPELLHALFDARDAAAAAQKQGDAEQVRTTVREYRTRLAGAVRAARDVLGEVGVEANAGQSRRIGESLQAASAGGVDARSKLLAGRLAQDVDVEDPFGGLEVGATTARRSPEPHRPDDSASRKREAAAQDARERALQRERAERERAIKEGRLHVMSLEEKARDARALAREAEVAAGRAQSAAEKARTSTRGAARVDRVGGPVARVAPAARHPDKR
jgi:hypothetical protein